MTWDDVQLWSRRRKKTSTCFSSHSPSRCCDNFSYFAAWRKRLCVIVSMWGGGRDLWNFGDGSAVAVLCVCVAEAFRFVPFRSYSNPLSLLKVIDYLMLITILWMCLVCLPLFLSLFLSFCLPARPLHIYVCLCTYARERERYTHTHTHIHSYCM